MRRAPMRRARIVAGGVVIAALLLLHALSSLLLAGAITHQAIAVWWPGPPGQPGWWRSLRAVRSARYAGAVVVLFALTTALGAWLYPEFRVTVRAPFLDARLPWATGLFEIKEHAAAIGLALLPAYWAAWRDPNGRGGARALTTLLLLITWWNWAVGHLVNNRRGL